jgi:ribulose-phosphate 3-epimerase
VSIRIAPSILSADYARLADGIAQAEAGGADWIHVDVMDGHFVPNITIGPPVLAAIRKVTDLPLDVHLMIERPEAMIEAFAGAGATGITVHQEATVHLHRVVESIHERGARAGVAINPATPVAMLDDILPSLDLVLIRSVNPGFGGQRFIEATVAKVAAVRARLDHLRLDDVDLEVDGGIAPGTAGKVVAAGADVLVAGAAIYAGKGNVSENIEALRRDYGG